MRSFWSVTSCIFRPARDALRPASGACAATMTRKPTPPVAREPLPSTPAADGTPITDVNKLPIVSSRVAATIKAAAGLLTKSLRMSATKRISTQPQADKPGTERWAVKTGQDVDRAKVGKNVIDGVD